MRLPCIVAAAAKANLRHSEVLRNLSRCTWISTLSEFFIVSTQRPDMTSVPAGKIVLVHLFEDFHALQEIELFLTRLLLGSH